MNAVVPISNAEVYRASTDAAGMCRDIVLKTAMKIGGRKYVRVEGWQALAVAHGCVASSEDVMRVEDEGLSGYRAMGVIRRMSDGAEIARAEGFLGDDETTWTKRPVYARRAMVQTRAISRACRSAFAHVVVLIDADLSTTPAEEMMGVQDDNEGHAAPRDVTPKPSGRKSSAAVVAAKNAILGCPTDELPGWLETNANALAECSKADLSEIMEFYHETAKPYVRTTDEPAAELVFQ